MFFGSDALRDSNPDTASSSDRPHSADLSTCPTISSVAVEPSYTSDENLALASNHATEPELRPAAEVFGFLLEKRRSRNDPSLAVPPTNCDLGSSTNRAHVAPATPLSSNQISSRSSGSQMAEVSALIDTPSTIGSILFDPPHTATILNHTRIPVAHGRLAESSRPGQLTVTAIATRRRIASERRSVRTPNSVLTSASETHLPSASPAEPMKPILAPTSCDDVLRSVTNAAEQTTVVAPHLSSKQGAAFASLPMRSAHRRSASYGPSRPTPVNWGAGPNGVVGSTRVKGLNGKENYASLCTFPLSHAIQ
jgi:hypothetical protein